LQIAICNLKNRLTAHYKRGRATVKVVPWSSVDVNDTCPLRYFSVSRSMLYVPSPRPRPLVEKDRLNNCN